MHARLTGRMTLARMTVAGLPDWVPTEPLLGAHGWRREGDVAVADLPLAAAADVAARLRGVHLGGRTLSLTVVPPLPRALLRAQRTVDARRRRDTTPGFVRSGVRLDEEGRYSLTPESLAMALAAPLAGCTVFDATCGAGGNTIAFARAGAHVVAVDRDPERLKLARYNAGVYGVAAAITFRAGNAEQLLPAHLGTLDLVFVDPAWGTAWDRARTPLAALPPLAALRDLARAAGVPLWAKVPPSFEVADWPEGRPEAVFGVAPGDRHRVKFVIVRSAAWVGRDRGAPGG